MKKNNEEAVEQLRTFNKAKAVADLDRVLQALKNPDLDKTMENVLMTQMIKLELEIQSYMYTTEEKVDMYLNGNADELPPDGNGKDEISGSLLPTDEEVMIGMYPKREIYYFKPYTCGVYMFYSDDMKFRYIGKSQYIEYALHSHFCRWRSQRKRGDTTSKKFLTPIRWMLDNHPSQLHFKILEKVPYSLLDVAVRNNRLKYKCMWQYDLRNGNKWTPENFLNGKYDY